MKKQMRKGPSEANPHDSSCPTLSRGPQAAGLSLPELLICCALIALLTLISFRGLQGMLPAARVNRALREVVELLEWSRWSAVRQGAVFRVLIHGEGRRLTVLRETENEEGEEELVSVRELDLRQDHPAVAFGTADGVKRTSGCETVDSSGIHLHNHMVRFLPSGTPDRSGSLYLIPEQDIPDREDRMRAISILLTTGRLQAWTFNPLEVSECPDDGAWQPL